MRKGMPYAWWDVWDDRGVVEAAAAITMEICVKFRERHDKLENQL